MSDLIGRIAARAVGAPAAAQPRVAEPLVGGGELEVADEEVVVPGAAPSPAAREPAPAIQGRAVEPGTAAPSQEAARPASNVEVPPVAASPGPAAEELPRPERPLPAPERASVDPAEVERGVPSAEPRVAAIAVPVPATPAVPVVSAPAPAPAAVAVAALEEPPPVRVHIGRLEVRANLQEAPRPAPVPQAAEPEGLSLSDYLRGRREA